METNIEHIAVSGSVQELAKKLQERKNSLYISRVPKGTRDTFIAIANEEFCSDYGMLLKYLLDKVIDGDNSTIIEELKKHDERIKNLEMEKQNKENNRPKMLNSNKIKKEVKR